MRSLFVWLLGILLRKADDRLAQNAFSPGHDDSEVKDLEVGNEVMLEGLVKREDFREWIAVLDGKLDRSFRDGQRHLLMSKASNLEVGEEVTSLFALGHGGMNTQLHMRVLGQPRGLFVSMRGAGAVMRVIAEGFVERRLKDNELGEFRECRVATPEYEALLDLRFLALREPLGLAWTADDLRWEQLERHFGLFLGEKAMACAVARRMKSGGMKLRQIAVAEKLRGRGIGRAIMLEVHNVLRKEGVPELELNSREEVAGFYEALGYAREGGIFEEIGIPHVKMRKSL